MGIEVRDLPRLKQTNLIERNRYIKGRFTQSPGEILAESIIALW
jgi:hypothetical protein